jgi:hypothetical protein
MECAEFNNDDNNFCAALFRLFGREIRRLLSATKILGGRKKKKEESFLHSSNVPPLILTL